MILLAKRTIKFIKDLFTFAIFAGVLLVVKFFSGVSKIFGSKHLKQAMN